MEIKVEYTLCDYKHKTKTYDSIEEAEKGIRGMYLEGGVLSVSLDAKPDEDHYYGFELSVSLIKRNECKDCHHYY